MPLPLHASWLLLPVFAACAVDIPPVRNVDLAGTWTLTVRNGENGCQFTMWDTGAVNTVELTFAHAVNDDSQVTGRLTGLLGFLVGVGLGATEFRGTIDGRDLDVSLFSDNQVQGPGTCMYTLQLRATATADGTTLRKGTLEYSFFTTNGSPDCQPLAGCRTIQTFEGLRTGNPPAPPDGGMQP